MNTKVDLRFDKIVTDYVNNHRYLPREWLANEVIRSLKTSQFVLLTAEPGFGKTAFMAQLADENPGWLRYFVQNDSLHKQANKSARQFLIDIGFQLASMHPKLMPQDKISVEIEQQIDNLNRGSDVLGLSVGTLRQSPFYSQMVIKIQQEAETEDGRMRAIHIDNIINDPKLLPLADLQELSLFGPAREFASQNDAELVILIDGLHEWLDSDAEGDILHWLTNHTGDLPNNVRFVLATRPPDDRWQTFMQRKQASLQHLSFDRNQQGSEKPPFHDQLDADVRIYAKQLWQDELYQPYLSELQVRQNSWVDTAVSVADGNLGYLDMLARTIDQAIAEQQTKSILAFLSLRETPDALITLFNYFFSQIKEATNKERIEIEDETGTVSYLSVWPTVYEPLLTVLATANEPLTFAQLHQQSKMQAGSEFTAAALDQLTPFLDHLNERYKLYHPALKDYLAQQMQA